LQGHILLSTSQNLLLHYDHLVVTHTSFKTSPNHEFFVTKIYHFGIKKGRQATWSRKHFKNWTKKIITCQGRKL